MEDKWAGWAGAGGLFMVMMGGFRAFTGFIGLFNQEWVVRGFSGYYFVDVGALAWWMLILGLLVALAGLGILAGQTWARAVGVIVLILGAISEFMWLPVYPIWSILMLAFYVVTIIALIAWEPRRD